ncbi:hypothetical protein A3A41_04440 [Candidatus Kaiserbacteria bacterium RIFCSPLOWO2_01_FULL_54_22]|nr:MAG: hypothetical protein A3A41_04440 [Candidatus Kaiserbacteria bacterium RIFCSPLOWO2_01_FULL_54_22]
MHKVSLIKLAGAAVVLALIALLLLSFMNVREPQIASITTFDECAAAGYPIMESYPEQCAVPGGPSFTNPRQQVDTSNDEMTFNGCAVAGCSGQLCVSADEAANIVTTCEYRAEYACYKEAHCGPQADGKCGWTQTPELQRCLANPPAIDTSLQVY